MVDVKRRVRMPTPLWANAMKQLLWYVFQASFVIGFLIFNFEYMEPPVQPGAAFIVGGALALFFTGLISKTYDLIAWLYRLIARRGYSR